MASRGRLPPPQPQPVGKHCTRPAKCRLVDVPPPRPNLGPASLSQEEETRGPAEVTTLHSRPSQDRARRPVSFPSSRPGLQFSPAKSASEPRPIQTTCFRSTMATGGPRMQSYHGSVPPRPATTLLGRRGQLWESRKNGKISRSFSCLHSSHHHPHSTFLQCPAKV